MRGRWAAGSLGGSLGLLAFGSEPRSVVERLVPRAIVVSLVLTVEVVVTGRIVVCFVVVVVPGGIVVVNVVGLHVVNVVGLQVWSATFRGARGLRVCSRMALLPLHALDDVCKLSL